MSDATEGSATPRDPEGRGDDGFDLLQGSVPDRSRREPRGSLDRGQPFDEAPQALEGAVRREDDGEDDAG